MYPQKEYPYAKLIAENRSRGKFAPEFEIEDTNVFEVRIQLCLLFPPPHSFAFTFWLDWSSFPDPLFCQDGFWEVVVEYGKGEDPDSTHIRLVNPIYSIMA